MNKLIFILTVLLSTPVYAEHHTCEHIDDWILSNRYSIDTIAKEIQLQRLDIASFNPSQHEQLDYKEKKETLELYIENYNAMVANHNHMVEYYKEKCQ